MGFQKLNNKGLQITSTFYAIIVAGIVLTGIGVLIATMGPFYGSDASYDLTQYGRNDNISDTITTYQNRLSPENANPGTDFEATTFTGSFGIINTLFAAFRVIFGSNGMLVGLATRFGIPAYIIQGIASMIIVGIAFAIVGIIFRLSKQP